MGREVERCSAPFGCVGVRAYVMEMHGAEHHATGWDVDSQWILGDSQKRASVLGFLCCIMLTV